MTTFGHRGRFAAIALVGSLALLLPIPGSAQGGGSFDAGIQVAIARSSEFDAYDAGIGGRFGWRPVDLLGVEGEINLYPTGFTEPRPFSHSRVEGLFGVTVGPSLGAFRPFGRVRSGFLTFLGASEPFPCILIYPPPLPCALAAGRTLPAVDVGGGVEILTPGRTFLRVDAGDRMVKYPGPNGFFSHDFRFAAGAGFRFQQRSSP